MLVDGFCSRVYLFHGSGGRMGWRGGAPEMWGGVISDYLTINSFVSPAVQPCAPAKVSRRRPALTCPAMESFAWASRSSPTEILRPEALGRRIGWRAYVVASTTRIQLLTENGRIRPNEPLHTEWAHRTHPQGTKQLFGLMASGCAPKS